MLFKSRSTRKHSALTLLEDDVHAGHGQSSKYRGRIQATDLALPSKRARVGVGARIGASTTRENAR